VDRLAVRLELRDRAPGGLGGGRRRSGPRIQEAALGLGIRDPHTVEGDHDLYGDGSIRLLATPGHTAGHQSVLVAPSEGPRVLIPGDAVYSEAALLSRTIDGVAVSPKRSRASIDRLRELCAVAPTIVAPTHDTDAARRVADRQVTSV
jgi:glyoxylase-like metal-dependent hydrolase (beta-lactamase superfamily II)